MPPGPRRMLPHEIMGVCCFRQWGLMSRFRILEHTADVGFEAFGLTLAEVFENAALALAYLIAEPTAVEPREEVSIEVKGTDAPDLLVNWLSEVLFQHDADRWLFRDFRVVSLDEHAVTGIAWGEKIDPARHLTNLMVKAVTYHQLSLQQTAGGWRAQVYVDI
ncbi:MAG TPA: archease [Terriglobia bacterium]|nr:archease [Terriglobia bacterium]